MGNDADTAWERDERDDLVALGRALSDPTRLAILAAVEESEGLKVGDLTERFGLHHSAIRIHLRVLVGVGLVVGEQAPSGGPGRPAVVYRAVPGAVERWSRRGPYQELADMLLDLVATGDDPRVVGRRAGHRLVAGVADPDPLVRLTAVTRRLGFQPSEPARDGDRHVLTLRTCPFAASIKASQDVVCMLHRGLAEGVVEATGLQVVDLVVGDPFRGGCRLVVDDG